MLLQLLILTNHTVDYQIYGRFKKLHNCNYNFRIKFAQFYEFNNNIKKANEIYHQGTQMHYKSQD